ncbi:hypothetical protein WK13_34385 [Burkholderia ubonensis]|uniref:DEAD/DEAH box helicase n=1 Tax=Burkholderia ubonensis TaxID=101571 RepID=UPI00075A18A7|nr:DEAD/DEAH box helicase family protein [Burkholderia ubonensis]KVR21628.1 hypothetical protein WK13_34385 [Burkholderia ubonensis]
MQKLLTDIPISTAAMSVYPYSAGLEAAYRFVPKIGEPFNAAIRRGNCLLVPRETCPTGADDQRVWKTPKPIAHHVEPRDEEQSEVIERVVKLLKAGISHICEAPTGFGKTIIGSWAGCELGQPTLILVTKEDLVHSWLDTLKNQFKVPESLIGHVQQDKCDYEGKAFVIGMVQSVVIPDKYNWQFFSYFGLVIFDEVHRMGADYFMQACTLFPAKLRLGLSATTKRSDGKWELVEAHVGPILVRGTQVPMKAKVLVRRTGWTKPHYMTATPGRMTNVSKAQANDPLRNKHILEFAGAAYQAGRCTTVIMSELHDAHLKPLFHMLAAHGIPGEDMDYYVGGRSKAALDTAAKKRIVLATYQMTAEGTNKPWWDTLVFGTPRANITQAIGRVIRQRDGKRQPVALDLLDNGAIFDNFFRSREKQYHEIGAEIVRMD